MRKNVIIFAILSLISTSCLTVRQIERNCDQFAKICLETGTETTTTTSDSSWTETRDTTVNYEIPLETVSDSIPIKIKPDTTDTDSPTDVPKRLSLYTDTSTLRTGLAHSTAYVSDDILYHFLESGDTILNIRLNDAITEVNRLKKIIRDSQTTNTVTVREDTPFGKFCKKWFFGTVILIIIGISGYILKLKKVF